MVLVATETDGRVRLAHADNNDEATLQRFARCARGDRGAGHDRWLGELQSAKSRRPARTK